jgi:hypothetical protein
VNALSSFLAFGIDRINQTKAFIGQLLRMNVAFHSIQPLVSGGNMLYCQEPLNNMIPF